MRPCRRILLHVPSPPQGTLSLVVASEADASLAIQLAPSSGNAGYQFKTHPNIDKGAYGSKGLLALRDPARPFPTNSELGVLKWRLQARCMQRTLLAWLAATSQCRLLACRPS